MRETLRIYQHVLDSEYPPLAEVLLSLGLLAGRVGDHHTEKACVRRALAIRRPDRRRPSSLSGFPRAFSVAGVIFPAWLRDL